MIVERKHFDLNNRCVIEKLRIKTPFRYGAVFQNEACFLYVRHGQGTVASPTEKLTLSVSESVLLKCGHYFADLMRHSKDEYCEIIAVHLPVDTLRELYKDEVPGFMTPGGDKHFARKIENEDIIVHFVQSLDVYFRNPMLVTDDLLRLKIKELILLLVRTKNAENVMSLFSHLFTPRQATLKEVVRTHLFSDITVGELAVLAGRSLSTFKRDFERQFNCPPATYIREQKLLKAIELLRSTDLSVSEICFEVGYSDTSHFTKVFRQKYRVTPSAYRKSSAVQPGV